MYSVQLNATKKSRGGHISLITGETQLIELQNGKVRMEAIFQGSG
jgi:hypothetical protein